MPLIRLSAAQAGRNRKDNPYSGWGDRSSANRVEPIAKPAFKVPFRIPRGARIFTVGSCFARNVEDELHAHGFDLPMRRLISRDMPATILNNYGTPSIRNEFAWAFGEAEYRAADHIVEIAPDRFADIHLSPQLRPEPYETVLARRRAITEAYRESADCAVLIMTLGLVECWFDIQSGYYLNVKPRPAHLRKEPDRFELHVLDFAECYDHLERAIDIAKRHNRHGLRVILTVSPVPLNATHRLDDAIVANAYSKSALRTAAETLAARHDFVTYFPSYESVVLSDRLRAFSEDFVHVSHELVALNVARMVDAFVADAERLGDMAARIAAGGHALAVEKARAAMAGPPEEAAAFFAAHGHRSGESADFALEHCRHLALAGDYESVLRVLDGAPVDIPVLQAAIARSEALIKLGRAAEAYRMLGAHGGRLDGPHLKSMKASNFWYALLDAAMATEVEEAVLEARQRFIGANGAHAAKVNLRVGHWHRNHGRLAPALGYYEMAVRTAVDPGDLAHLTLAECLAELGRPAEARAALGKFQPRGAGSEFRAARLAERLDEEATIPAGT